MNEGAIGRRTFLAGAAALTASGALQPGEGRAQTPVPNSSGTEPAKLNALDTAGIRGIRFTLQDPATAVVKWDMVEPLAKRVAGLGWHLQFNLDGEQVADNADLLGRLPTPLVFDHMGHPTLPAGID